MRTVVALVLGCALAACRASSVANEPHVVRTPPRSPDELFPDDLDFVVRIDVARIRQNAALTGIVGDLAKTRSELLAPIQSAMGEASAVWVGTRWMSDGFHGDGIVAIEGSPGAFASAPSSSWRRLATPLPDVTIFEGPARARGEPVLHVVMDDRGLVLATAAEADAVLRVLRTGADEKRLEPPARGLVSFAGRLRGSSPLGDFANEGMLRSITEGLVVYAGSLEERPAEMQRTDSRAGAPSRAPAVAVEASLTYASAGDATRAAERAREAISRLAAAGESLEMMANSAKITEVGSSLELRAEVPFAWLMKLH